MRMERRTDGMTKLTAVVFRNFAKARIKKTSDRLRADWC
jgi:hypothetical protein